MLSSLLRRRTAAPVVALAGKPTDHQVRAHVAFTRSADHTAASARVLSDVEPFGDPCLGIVSARRVRACVTDTIDVAVIRALVCGATWREVAAALTLEEHWVRDHYGPIYERWKAGESTPWRPALPAGAELVGLPGLP
jgi:hypothetical protein